MNPNSRENRSQQEMPTTAVRDSSRDTSTRESGAVQTWNGTSAGQKWAIYQGAALDVLKELDSEYVDCIITSPPYFWLRDYDVEGQIGLEDTVEDYVSALLEVMAEARRVLKCHGVTFLNLGDTYYSGKGKSHGTDAKSKKRRFGLRAVDKSGGLGIGLQPKSLIGIPWRVALALAEDGWVLRSAIIWHRKNGLPEFVRDRPSRTYEYVFMLARNRRYHFAKNELPRQDRRGYVDNPGATSVERRALHGTVPGRVGQTVPQDRMPDWRRRARPVCRQRHDGSGRPRHRTIRYRGRPKRRVLPPRGAHIESARMMYISESTILGAIDELKASTHPFVGITFLACKKFGLPVGKTVRVKLDTVTKQHLKQHHRLDVDSSYFFQPFKSARNWVKGNYASTGLQAVNTQTFGNVFLHERGSPEWGFTENYIDLIQSAIRTGRYRKMPLAAIAIWVAKDREWAQHTTLEELVKDFLRRYNITPGERRALFSPESSLTPITIIARDVPPSLVQSEAPDLKAIAHRIAPPPDAHEPEGTLMAIEMSRVGPADKLRLDLGKRLTVIAGDNGLGKSFLLDVAWWAATGRWAGRPAMPFGREAADAARLSYELRTDAGRRTCYSRFEPRLQTWVHQRDYPQVPALYVYAGVDGTFSIEDDHQDETDEAPLNFTAREIWDGKPGRMEGLVRDWVNWQLSSKVWFSVFERVLSHLSPSDLGTLQPAPPRRMPGDPRMIPIISHPYGMTPVLYASAGVRRIMALAYVIVWAWQEHLLGSELRGVKPARRLLLLVDELDAHLHPFWQRTILPAILDIGKLLDKDLQTQIVVSTHSPFVLASLETRFDPSSDALYLLRLEDANVHLRREEFYKHGDVSSWLTAPIFGLHYARSKDAERVLEQAMQLQLARSTDPIEIQRVSDRLKQVLPSDDPFWRRWIYFAQQAGAKL